MGRFLLPLVMLLAATALLLRAAGLWSSVEALADGGPRGPLLAEVPPPEAIPATPLPPLPQGEIALKSLEPLSSGPAADAAPQQGNGRRPEPREAERRNLPPFGH